MTLSSPDSTPENVAARASLELLYNVSRELTQALDLRTVLQRVVFLAMRTVGAISGSIIVLDDSGKPLESAIITGAQVHDHTTQRLRATLERGLAGWVVRNRQAVLIADTSRDQRWMARQYEPDEKPGAKSAVSAPLWVRDRLVGVMTLVHPRPGFFTNDHLALVQAISDQAGIAVLNARLYTESQHRARVMTALTESAKIITASLNLEEVLQRIIEQVSQALRVEAAALALTDAEGQTLVFRAATGWLLPLDLSQPLPLGKSFAGWVAEEGHGIIVHDALHDPRFDPEITQRTGVQARTVACAPILYRAQTIGVIEAVNPLEGTFDSDALLVLTGIGSLAGTAIRHAQLFERLQAAHESYRELFEDNIDPILITDWQGNISKANRQAVRLTDYSKDTLRHMNIRQLHTVDEEAVGERFEKLTPEQTVSYESLLRVRQQADVPVQVYVRPVEIEESSHLQWIFRDLTERKHLDTLREDLTSMIYHDLRSPLANVVSSLDVLDTILPDEETPTLRPMLDIAIRSVERIQRLTNSLLDINRLEAGQPITNLEPFDPVELISDALETVFPVAEGKHQTITTQLGETLPAVMVDADMIRRVLTNLLENAIKFTPNEGKIIVGAEPDEGWLRLWVQDNGPGIPASEQERIFDKFTRLNASGAPKGFGLGLAYCRLAVEGHGGRIWVETPATGGARFTFTLPIATGL